MSRIYNHTCEVCAGNHVPDPCCFGCTCGSTDPPTIDEIRDAISFMRSRLESGQGLAHQAMTRLSLTMSEALLAEYESAAITLEPASPAHDPLTCPCCAAAAEMRDELRVPIYEDAGARQESSEHVVWGDDEGEGCDGQIILADDPEEAACEWACRVDHASAAYPILIGHASPTANVRAPDGALTRWVVTGVPLPHYSARRTK